MAEDSVEKQQKQRGRPFLKGQSGNPAGRPRGSRNRGAREMQLLLDGEAQALTRKAVELALEGDTTALRLCFERLMPPRRDRATPLSIPAVRGAGDLMPAMAGIFAAAARGKISPGEGMGLAKLLDIFLNAIEVRDFDARLRVLENADAPV
jgi:Family of unknown function (DUF5681)